MLGLTKRDWLALAGFVALCQAAGIVGTLFTAQAIPEWYALLNKPTFSPPNWVFGPVWVTLYTLMGGAAFLVWRRGAGLMPFWVQLALNALWTPVFFGMHNIGLGLVIIAAMWCAIVWTIVSFWPVSRTAALLLVPYLTWVTFATVLNASLWMLN
jgi:benzodiazapine receptor